MMEKSSFKTLVIQSQSQPLPFSWLEPCMESAGMFSPEVIREFLVDVADSGHSGALDLMRRRSVSPVTGANLCSSPASGESEEKELSNAQMELLVEPLIANGAPV